jgi:pilus assembly protein CpaF
VSGVRDFNIDFSVADAPPSKRERKTPVLPISVEELIDVDNPLPMRTIGHVKEATSYVRRFADDAEDGGFGQKFADRLVQARESGAGSGDFQSTANQVDDLVLAWKRSNPVSMGDGELRWIRARVIDNMLGAGAIEPLRRDPRVTEILVRAHAPHPVATESGERLSGGCVTEIYGVGLVDAPGVVFGDDQEVLDFIARIHPDGKRPTPTHPNMSAALPDGSRLEAAHPCVTDGASTFLALRRHPDDAHTLVNLVEWGTVSEELATELASMVRARLNLVIAGGTSSGKALDVDTPIPTPDGFVPMGELAVGDRVFSDLGVPCTVMGAFDIDTDRDCYEVVFSDGSRLIADGDHLWDVKVTRLPSQRFRHNVDFRFLRGFPSLRRGLRATCQRVWKRIEHVCEGADAPTRTLTTLDTAWSLRNGYRCSIPVALPVAIEERPLPVDPYLFGLWFATGKATASQVDVSKSPPARVRLSTTKLKVRTSSKTPHLYSIVGFQKDLRDAGIKKAHEALPDMYLLCSQQQRQEVLKGILSGFEYSFFNTDRVTVRTGEDRIVDAIRCLTSSLGRVVSINQDLEDTFTVTVPMGTLSDYPPSRRQYKNIVAIRPAPPRPVRCIEVSSPSALYLAGKEFNPTHNTTTLNALVPFLPEHVHLSIIEDTPELKDPSNLRLVSRRVSRPGSGDVDDVTIRSHIRSALRSRPDVIIIGEVRGPEAVDALTAMNTGHEGSMVTCHSNSAHETVVRLESMMSEAGEISEGAATHKIASSIDIVIHQARLADGRRRITGVYEVQKPPLDSTKKVESVALTPLWNLDRETGAYVKHADVSEGLLDTRNVAEKPALTMDDVQLIHEVAQRSSSARAEREGR